MSRHRLYKFLFVVGLHVLLVNADFANEKIDIQYNWSNNETVFMKFTPSDIYWTVERPEAK